MHVEPRLGRVERLNVKCSEKERGVDKVSVGPAKGNTGAGRDQTGVLEEGSDDVWPRPEEVSHAAPSCEKVTLG